MKDLDVVCVPCEDIESLGISLGASVFWSLCGVVPVKVSGNHDGDFDSVLPVSQGSPYSRRNLAVSKDFGGRRRASRDHGSRSSSRTSQAKTESQSSRG
jgi:hypothetical protein